MQDDARSSPCCEAEWKLRRGYTLVTQELESRERFGLIRRSLTRILIVTVRRRAERRNQLEPSEFRVGRWHSGNE